MNWVLVIAMLSPGGDYIDKIPVAMPTRAACQKAAKELPQRSESPLGVQYKAICVTMDHWNGKKKMKDMSLD